MNKTPLVEFRDVCHAADGTCILDHISWTLERDHHWAVLGPNGSGKTTLLRVLAGHLWPNRGGTVLRLGQRLLDLRDLWKSIGWVSSTMIPQVPPHENSLDTVVSGRWAQIGLKRFRSVQPTKQDFEEAEQHLKSLNCERLIDRHFGVLSQGEKQSVLVARARMARPLMIILDESCAGMDPGVRETFLGNLAQMLADPHAPRMVFVTHHVEEILPAVDRTLILDRGQVVAAGPTRDIISAESLSTLYRVPIDELIDRGGRLWPIVSDGKALLS
ncbi:MAG: ATP-binding cassette domain-containing protein [Planctomycetales bacterium]|nr:ATP-binding cassette domain-containing protein [Planctomycetales bacterium]